jgi:hypothetical protein
MKLRVLLVATLLIGGAGTALAEEYYVVSSSSAPYCIITTSKPVASEIVTQIGPMAFKSREEAEARIKETKVCQEGTVGVGAGGGSTVEDKTDARH